VEGHGLLAARLDGSELVLPAHAVYYANIS